MGWSDLYALGATRHGVVALHDAACCGVAENTLRHRAAAERWPLLHRGVWALPGAPDTPGRECAAALAAAGPHAVLARRSAGWVWRLREAPPVPEVIFPHGHGTTEHPGIVGLRSRTLREADCTVESGLRVTTVARTVADLARVTSAQRLTEMVVRARQRGMVELPQLAIQVAVMRKTPGIPKLRAVVDLMDGDRVDSLLEAEVRAGIRRAGLPAPASEPLWLGSGPGRLQIDIAWPREKVGVEVDGFANHHSAEDLARDHRKTNTLAVAGWTLLRIGYLRWHADRPGFIAELRAVLAAAGAVAGGDASENGHKSSRVVMG